MVEQNKPEPNDIDRIVQEVVETRVPILYMAISPRPEQIAELREKFINTGRVLPITLKMSEELKDELEKALYEFVKKHRGIDKLPSGYGIRDVRQFSFVLDVAGLRPFVIVRHADDVDVSKLLKDLKAMEDLFAYAGVMLVFRSLEVFRQKLGEIEETWLKRGHVVFF